MKTLVNVLNAVLLWSHRTPQKLFRTDIRCCDDITSFQVDSDDLELIIGGVAWEMAVDVVKIAGYRVRMRT